MRIAAWLYCEIPLFSVAVLGFFFGQIIEGGCRFCCCSVCFPLLLWLEFPVLIAHIVDLPGNWFLLCPRMLLKIYKTCLKPFRDPVKTLQGSNGSYTKNKCWCWLTACWFPCTLFKFFFTLTGCIYMLFIYVYIYVICTRALNMWVWISPGHRLSLSQVCGQCPACWGAGPRPAFLPTAVTWDFTRDRWAEVCCRQCLEDESRRCSCRVFSWETRHEKLPWVKAKVDGGAQSDGKQITETGKESCPGQ